MAKLTITFQDDIKFTRDLEANCRHHGYQETIKNEKDEDIPNPQSKQDFIEQTLKRMFKEASKAQRQQEAINNLNIEK